jgi:hypothetical protein
MLLVLWPLLEEEPIAPPSPPISGGGGRPVFLPRQPVPLSRLAPVQRVRVRYGPATITGWDTIPVLVSARPGPALLAGHAAVTVNLEATIGRARIVADPDYTVLVVRAALPDNDFESILLTAAALWE